MERVSRFPFDPWHGGDPGPEIWRIIQELEVEHQRQIVGVIIETEINKLEAQVNGLRQVGAVLKGVAGK